MGFDLDKLSDSEKALFTKTQLGVFLWVNFIQRCWSKPKLRNPIYSETAAYGYMGRKNEVVTKTFKGPEGTKTVEVELFTWKKLDFVDAVKAAFAL